MAHGGGATFGVPGVRPNIAAGDRPPQALDPRSFQGFSYFFGQPSGGQKSTLGADPARARQIAQALYSLLPVSDVPLGEPVANQCIPAGYTYLLQFIAHDLVDSTVPLWVAAESGIPGRNMRSVRLQLDTLYGGGPAACPIAFKPAGTQPDFRSLLRLGRVSDADRLGLATGPCPFRDLPRLRLNRSASPPATPMPGPSNFDEIWRNPNAPSRADQLLDDAAQVFVADIRNDDTLTLTQLVVLFSILHNAVAAKLGHVSPQARFAFARAAMLRIYHSVVRNDLLPRLLRDEVVQTLANRPASSCDWLWDGQDIPLEFSHGAFRIGHAMVNSSYVFNAAAGRPFSIYEVVGGPLVGSGVRDPLPSSWVIMWSKFFQFTDMDAPNFSLKLSARKQMPLDFTGLLPEVGPNQPHNLSVRDWLSAAAARMWRPDALIAAIRQRYPGLSFVSPGEFRRWFATLSAAGDMAGFPDAIRQNPALLTDDLPLPLYILVEAELDPVAKGQRLGPLGSIIVGEVMFRALAEAEAVQSPLLPATEQALGEDAWRSIDGVKTMPALIELARDWAGLSDCPRMPFIAAPTPSK